MPTTMDRYIELVSAFPDTESLTVLTVANATRDQVAAQLGVDLSTPVDDDIWADDEHVTGWALLEVPGGVLAVELSGFGDPSNDDLTALSAVPALPAMPGGGGSAVIRSNVLAHYRFGCARNGELLFDDDEFIFTDRPEAVPDELRPLFDLVYDDLSDEGTENEGEDDDTPSPFAVGLAMAEAITGVEITAAHISSVYDAGFFAAPSQRYPNDFTDDEAGGAYEIPDTEDDPLLEDDTEVFDPRRPYRDSRDIAVRSGAYAIAADAASVGEPPADWPDGTLCVTEGETVWIRKLSTNRDIAVRPQIWAGSFEPRQGFDEIRAISALEGSAVLTDRGALRIVDNGRAFDDDRLLTSGGYRAELRVFVEAAGGADDHETHFLYVWPEDGVYPDWLDQI